MNALTGITFVLATLMPARAPVPPDPDPNPLARGYMGITVQTGGLTIENVQPNTGAAKAGLRTGDVLVRIGTLEPREFNQVVAHVCSFRPGAMIEVVVQRGPDRKTVKMKLGTRPLDLDVPGQLPGRPLPKIDD